MEEITLTAEQLLALKTALKTDDQKVPKESVNYRHSQKCGNCSMFRSKNEYGEGDSGTCDLVAGPIDRYDVCDKWDAADVYERSFADGTGFEKSAETPSLMATPDILGPEGLWHTPSKKVPTKQKLPNYVEHIADALMRAGHGEQEAIAFAVNAVKRWSRGQLGWGKKKVTPEVQAAAKKTLQEWNDLKASHH